MTKEEKDKLIQDVRNVEGYPNDGRDWVNKSRIIDILLRIPETPSPSPYAVVVEVPEIKEWGNCSSSCAFMYPEGGKNKCNKGWGQYNEERNVFHPQPGPGCPRYVEPVDPIMEMYNPSDSLTEEQKEGLDNLNHELHKAVSDWKNRHKSKNILIEDINHIHDRAKEVLGCE